MPSYDRTVQFSVNLSRPALESVTAHWRTQDGTAMAGVDYEATEGDLTFAPGEVTKVVDVPTVIPSGDARKFFSVVLSSISGAVANPQVSSPAMMVPPGMAPFGPGTRWRSGDDAPSSDVGSNGDYYLRINGDVFGPKAGGAWAAPFTNLNGPSSASAQSAAESAEQADQAKTVAVDSAAIALQAAQDTAANMDAGPWFATEGALLGYAPANSKPAMLGYDSGSRKRGIYRRTAGAWPATRESRILGDLDQQDQLRDRDAAVVERPGLYFGSAFRDGEVIETDSAGNIIGPSVETRATRLEARPYSEDRPGLSFNPAHRGASVIETDPDGNIIAIFGDFATAPEPTLDAKLPTLSDRVMAEAALGVTETPAVYFAREAAWPAEDTANNTLASAYTLVTDPAALQALCPVVVGANRSPVNRCIPQPCWADGSGRLWRHSYGNNGPLGTNPESNDGVGQFALLEYTSAFANGADPATNNETDDVQWVQAAAIVGNGSTSVYIADSMLFYTPDRRLVWAQTMRFPSNKHLTVRSRVLANPDTGTPGSFSFGPDTFFGYDFPFFPERIGNEYRFFMATKGSPRPIRYARLKIHDGAAGARAYAETISEVPGCTNPADDDYPEPVGAHMGESEIALLFRSRYGLRVRRSYDDGRTWTADEASWFESNPASTNAKALMRRTPEPDGRLIAMWNAASTRRGMSVAWTPKGATSLGAFVTRVLLDNRFPTQSFPGPNQTYPGFVFPTDALGRWTGDVIGVWDVGRSVAFNADGSRTGAEYQASVSGTTATLTEVVGTVGVGQKFGLSPTGTVISGTTIVAQLTGTPGGDGTYQLSADNGIITERPGSTSVASTTPGTITYSELQTVKFNLAEFVAIGDQIGRVADSFPSFRRYTSNPHGPPYSP